MISTSARNGSSQFTVVLHVMRRATIAEIMTDEVNVQKRTAANRKLHRRDSFSKFGFRVKKAELKAVTAKIERRNKPSAVQDASFVSNAIIKNRNKLSNNRFNVYKRLRSYVSMR
jgi:hypothetical protein